MTKNKRHFLILAALLAVVLSSIACVDDGYQVIQDGQNAVKEAGKDVKEAVNDSDILSAPTGVELNTGGLIDVLGDAIESEAAANK